MIVKTDPKKFRLVACDEEGRLAEGGLNVPRAFRENSAGTASLYRRIGFAPPWIGYASVYDGRIVGGGAFVGAPKEGAVEIAYFTLDGFERRGFAGLTARRLVALARDAAPGVTVTAKTLPQENASTRILLRLGFVHCGVTEDDDVGEAWSWRLPPKRAES